MPCLLYIQLSLGYDGYLAEVVSALTGIGLHVEIAATSPNLAPRAAADELRDYLNCFPVSRQLVLIGVGKGGVDVANALSMYPDECCKRVVAFVSMQAPFGGSIAVSDMLSGIGATSSGDDVTERTSDASQNPQSRMACEGAYCGSLSVIEASMSHSGRMEFLAKYPPHVILSRTKVLSVAGAASIDPPFSCTPLFECLLRRLKKAYPGVESDGSVAVEDAIIPGSSYAVLDGMDAADASWGQAAFKDISMPALYLALVHVALLPHEK